MIADFFLFFFLLALSLFLSGNFRTDRSASKAPESFACCNDAQRVPGIFGLVKRRSFASMIRTRSSLCRVTSKLHDVLLCHPSPADLLVMNMLLPTAIHATLAPIHRKYERTSKKLSLHIVGMCHVKYRPRWWKSHATRTACTINQMSIFCHHCQRMIDLDLLIFNVDHDFMWTS